MARRSGNDGLGMNWTVALALATSMTPMLALADGAVTKKLFKDETSPTGTLYINGDSAWLITKETEKDLATMRQYVGPNDTDNLADAAGSLCLYRKEIPSTVTKVSFAAIFPNGQKAVVVYGDQNLPVMLCNSKPDEVARIEKGNRKVIPTKQLPVQPL